jgi:hypothetical protein
MQQPESPENRFPDCVYLELNGIKTKKSKGKNKSTQIDLRLTINFNEQEIPIVLGSKVKFGLKGGELSLNLKGGLISYKNRSLTKDLDLKNTLKRTVVQGSEQKQGAEVSFLESIKITLKGIFETKNNSSITEELETKISTVTTKGDVENPKWVFESLPSEHILKGTLADVPLALIDITQFPLCIEAIFTVSMKDVKLTEADGLFSPDISNEKKAAIDRGIIKLLIRHKFKDYLSKQVLTYEQ